MTQNLHFCSPPDLQKGFGMPMSLHSRMFYPSFRNWNLIPLIIERPPDNPREVLTLHGKMIEPSSQRVHCTYPLGTISLLFRPHEHPACIGPGVCSPEPPHGSSETTQEARTAVPLCSTDVPIVLSNLLMRLIIGLCDSSHSCTSVAVPVSSKREPCRASSAVPEQLAPFVHQSHLMLRMAYKLASWWLDGWLFLIILR